MKLFTNLLLATCLLTGHLLSGCQPTQKHAETATTTDSTAIVKYAKFFNIEQRKDYTLLTIIPFEGSKVQYVLYPKASPVPTLPDNSQPIAVPIESGALYGTTYAHLFELLDCQHIIKGFAGTSYLYGAALRQAVAAGSITELGAGNQLNVELLNQLKPDIVMMYAGANDADKLSLLQRTGLKVIINADFMENTPLGRAEWLKVVGLLCNKSHEADSIFNQIEQNYQQLVLKVGKLKQKPTVFANVPYGNTWYMPGGNSFMANFLKDAGADYLWQHEAQTGSLPLSLEAVFSRIQTADYWVNPGSMESLEMIRKTDTRFGLLKAVQSGKVFNNNKRQLPGGGNDYWESGSARPDLVLADLIAIFHPETLPNHSFTYFQQLQ
jgi:iron complex transport system substrate-binding protein